MSVAAPTRHSKMEVQFIESNRSGKNGLHDGHSYNQINKYKRYTLALHGKIRS